MVFISKTDFLLNQFSYDDDNHDDVDSAPDGCYRSWKAGVVHWVLVMMVATLQLNWAR